MNTISWKNKLLILLVIAIVIAGYLLYKEHKENQVQYERFLNHFYHHLESVVFHIEKLMEANPSGDELKERMYRLKERLDRIDQVYKAGHLFVDQDIRYTSYFSEMAFVTTGIRMTVNNEGPFIITAFAEDTRLSEKEMYYLTLLKSDLASMKQSMYSEETKQENPNISIQQFNELVTDVAYQDPYDFYVEIEE
ncbi:hypothetical protein [Salirhabdus salicampi]|uniref:hypothetical protein n=1 Tax=Salirhabdus salicampi TaxID=476102 RepID=UPI0020C1D10A|nr:hypothetical protein [Salirhabdus salicampi]MCP8616838.1 hypothetical protein [Salirhabdus salicampi]